MPRKVEEIPLEKVTIRLFAGQMDRLRELHGNKINPNKLIRTLLAAYINKVEAKAADLRQTVELPEMEMDDE